MYFLVFDILQHNQDHVRGHIFKNEFDMYFLAGPCKNSTYCMYLVILLTAIHSYPVCIKIKFWVYIWVYSYTLCLQAEKVQVRLCTCAFSPEPSLLASAISTEICRDVSLDLYFLVFIYIIT